MICREAFVESVQGVILQYMKMFSPSLDITHFSHLNQVRNSLQMVNCQNKDLHSFSRRYISSLKPHFQELQYSGITYFNNHVQKPTSGKWKGRLNGLIEQYMKIIILHINQKRKNYTVKVWKTRSGVSFNCTCMIWNTMFHNLNEQESSVSVITFLSLCFTW